MKILVCFKFIRDEEGISVNADRTINLDSAPWVISPYDLNAIEAGMKLAAEAGESTVEVLTVGGEALDNSKMRKAVLSRGPRQDVWRQAPVSAAICTPPQSSSRAPSKRSAMPIS